jgi:hypothetical protein
MQNIQKLYQDLHEGKISRNQFLFQLRKDSRINSFFTSANSYDETVRILKNRGLLFEIKINENQESKVRFEKNLKDGNIFQVIDRDTRGMGMSIGIRAPQDQFSMQIVDKDGKVVKNIGSHVSLDGAKSYSDRFESIDEEIGSNDPETSHEGLDNLNEAKNIPKVEKLVNVINDMIAKAVDEDGDPVGVFQHDSTWQVPDVYLPIQYKNGRLKISKIELYGTKPEVEVINNRDVIPEGVPYLRMIATMYKKLLKKLGNNQQMPSAPSQEETDANQVYENDLNEAKEPTKGADQVNPYELEKGTYYEMDYQKDGAKDPIKAKAKALKNLNKNPKYYSDLLSKDYNDKPSTSDQMQVVKESLKNLIDDILSEK